AFLEFHHLGDVQIQAEVKALAGRRIFYRDAATQDVPDAAVRSDEAKLRLERDFSLDGQPKFPDHAIVIIRVKRVAPVLETAFNAWRQTHEFTFKKIRKG